LASIFPSLYEGLGLPVIESYAAGKPVLASDTSSLPELVPPICQFDPHDATSIADAVRRFQDDPSIAGKSMAFAAEVLALSRWPGAVNKIAAWVDGSPAQPEGTREIPMFVVSSLPPDRSGVSFLIQNSLGAPSHPVTFFSPVRGAAGLDLARTDLARTRHRLQLEAAPAEILALGTLADARTVMPRQPVLFVLGNSEHHLPTLNYLLRGGAGPDDWVHLHDVFLGDLLRLHYTKRECGAEASTGPLVLVRDAGVRQFIVNSTAAADRLRSDLGTSSEAVRIEVLFHPVLPARSGSHARSRAVPDTEVLRVGHFGILNPHKQIERLIEACDILAASRRIELVLAGYEVRRYLQTCGLTRLYQDVIESPSDEELQLAMTSVDCAVQLRYPDMGESSGVVHQLLALRKPVICTRTGSFVELEGAVTLVESGVSATHLSIAIERAASSGWPVSADAIVAVLSPLGFEARLREILAHAISGPY
jgi:glycosyltransferase involved in cell wall biosynthesis